MKTIVVLSDSHYRGAVRKLGPLFQENDYIVHLGDGSGEMRSVLDEYPDKVRVCVAVKSAYGHTHIADIRDEGGVLCINPGALGAYADASYCYLVLHKGKMTPTIVPFHG